MLTALRFLELRNHHAYWLFKCDCGNEKALPASPVRSGNTKSCGCLKIETLKKPRKHGDSRRSGRSAEYRCWCDVKTRVRNSNRVGWKNYGGREEQDGGPVTLAERWKVYANFIADMGRKPGPKYSIERRDNKLGYCPENCYWGTRKEQANNTRQNRIIEFQGQRLNTHQWAEKTGIKYWTLRSRLFQSKWSVEKALTIPTKKPGQKIQPSL